MELSAFTSHKNEHKLHIFLTFINHKLMTNEINIASTKFQICNEI